MEGALRGGAKEGVLSGWPSALAAFGLPLPSLTKKRDDGPENFLILIGHLDERETHVHKSVRIFPAIQIGPHHLAFDDDLFPVGKFDDQLVDLVLGKLLLAVDKYTAGGDISRFTLDHALARNDRDGPVHTDSG